MEAKVNHVVDGDTFDIINGWSWNGQTGTRIRPTGYNAPEVGTPGAAFATHRLRGLILGQTISLRNPVRVDRGRLVIDVFLNGTNIASYFN